MTTPAKDVRAIYSSYNLDKYQYMEVKQAESYVQAKNKWLIFHSTLTDYEDTDTLPNKDTQPVVEPA